ncbi:type II CAAX prenyl endopeptidase Rce1 family protein [Sediminibacterium sp.]|uniref:CPBP family glutamic-type intramembrane protease n=1 Tax=Sediminibacterium sp. TaxID=1917865 RepID=UPI002732CE73|nr:CPBP family glutamic-type intramembrane protease [Sediminibacterium sp.]MDP3392468.1 CPBP family glutamic-type intramembrane protease [Sediminibacterium sp.]MDP3565734.1 CPBP family glutamic-type intramembrane protease [Sediminibacterium sp.]
MDKVKFNSTYISLIEYISSFDLVKSTFLVILINLLVTILFSYILFPKVNIGANEKLSLLAFTFAVIIIPMIETLVFQNFFVGYFIKKDFSNILLVTFISSLLFSFAHFYSIAYIFKTFVSGFLYCTLFLVAFRKVRFPFISVFIAHATFNCIGFCIDYFLK